MKKTIKVQENSSKHNRYINIPKEMTGKLGIVKGDTLLLSMEGEKITMEKC